MIQTEIMNLTIFSYLQPCYYDFVKSKFSFFLFFFNLFQLFINQITIIILVDTWKEGKKPH